MLHSDARKSKEAEYKQELLRNNPENAGWHDGEEKTAAVHQDKAFEKRSGEILYVPNASFLTVPTLAPPDKKTKLVRNNNVNSGTDFVHSNDQDPAREKRSYMAGADWEQFLVDPDTAAYVKLVSEFTTGMAGTVTLSKNGSSEVARLPSQRWISMEPHARQGMHCGHMQLAQLRGLAVVIECRGACGARCWELCSLSSKQAIATCITPPDGRISIAGELHSLVTK